MFKILLIVILLILSITLNADTYTPIVIGEKNKEKPNIENNFNNNKYNYTSNSPESALLFLGLDYLLSNKIYNKSTKDKKININFEYLDEFEKNVHIK